MQSGVLTYMEKYTYSKYVESSKNYVEMELYFINLITITKLVLIQNGGIQMQIT